jgi:altered-inheritance-of-mitochondria protein 13
LRKLEDRQSEILKDLEAKISSAAEEVPDTDSAEASGDRLRQLGRDAVQQDIQSLRQKLEARKKIEGLDEGVKKAKEAVVACLRTNDRRPLDCWKEVEAFQREVARLERNWVEKTVR